MDQDVIHTYARPCRVTKCYAAILGCFTKLSLPDPSVYQRVMSGIPVALADPFFRLDLARAVRQAGLDLFPPTGPGK